jgi:hypothetical protein
MGGVAGCDRLGWVMSGFGIQRMGSEAFRCVVGCWGAWLAERERLAAFGRRFIKAASVQVRRDMLGFVFAGAVRKNTYRGLIGMIAYGIGTTCGVQNDIREEKQGTRG